MRAVLAFSGGLDTSFCVAWLREERGAEVTTVFVDTGGTHAEQRTEIRERALTLGAVEHVEIDARDAVYDGFVATLIRGNVLRGEVYPLCVAAERTQQAIEVARAACRRGADAIVHGSTGAGNDQIRFDVAFRVLAPELELITPIRSLGLERPQAIAFLQERGLPVPGEAKNYSVNAGLWGTTIGGSWTHDPWSAPPEDCWDEPTAQQTEHVVVDWELGLPVALDGVRSTGPQLIEALGERVRTHGIGRGIHIGETALGIKGRIGFEAGAAVVLVHAHRELEKLTLTRSQAFWKDHVARVYGDRLHEGQAFDPLMQDLRALIDSSQRTVEGQTRIALAPGRFAVDGVRSPHSLLDANVAVYGETNALWTGDEARAFAKMSSIPAQLASRSKQSDTTSKSTESSCSAPSA